MSLTYREFLELKKGSYWSEADGILSINVANYNPAELIVPDYNVLVKEGTKRAAASNIVIAGLMRNASNNFYEFRKLACSIGRMFKSYNIVIYENDSSDNTVELLNEWKSQDDNFYYISEKVNNKNYGSVLTLERMQFMTYCRNRYLQYIDDNFPETDYVIVLDCDIKDVLLNGILSSFGVDGEWDCITSNGIDFIGGTVIYYDISALVVSGLMRNAYCATPIGGKNKMYGVDSAFGGLAIYRYPSIKGKKYLCGLMAGDKCDWHPDERPMCDHTGLNIQLDTVLINPWQIVLR